MTSAGKDTARINQKAAIRGTGASLAGRCRVLGTKHDGGSDVHRLAASLGESVSL